MPAGHVEECYIDLRDDHKNNAACNYVLVSGKALKLRPSSNYIGASHVPHAVSGRVVWWTTVGAGAQAGWFTHLVNYGGGWNGPFELKLPHGLVDFAYVRQCSDLHPRAASLLHIVGQGIVGSYRYGVPFAAWHGLCVVW